jgi:hypothetical protein
MRMSSVFSLSEYKYYLVILDDFFALSLDFLLCLKSDTFTTFTLLCLDLHLVRPLCLCSPVRQ